MPAGEDPEQPLPQQPLQQRSWRQHYSAEELAHFRRLMLRDVLGIPVFVGWYFVLAAVAGLLTAALGDANGSGETVSTPVAILILQGTLAVLGIIAFVLQSTLLPPNKEDDMYHAQAHIGGWVFLTRHCLALQAVHLVASLLSSLAHSSWLARATSSIALWMGALGGFVTTQYFTLVHFNPEFKRICAQALARDPPYHLRTRCIWIHIFALPLAVLDVAVAKQHAPLREFSSLVTCLILAVFYILFYVGLIVSNFRITGRWPYEFLKGLTTLGKWVTFVLAQSVIMSIFCLIMWSLALLPSAW